MIFRELKKKDYEEYDKLINEFRPSNFQITREIL